MSETINIGIVEDNFLFREGLKAIINNWPKVNVMFEASEGYSVIDGLANRTSIPDVMIVDLSLPANNGKEYSGLHLTKDLLQQYPDIKIIILSVHSYGSYINDRALKALQQNLNRKKRTSVQVNLEITKREIEILQLVCEQLTAEEIADKLFISVKTVNGHRNNLLQKTGSRNVTGLVIYAIKNGIVTIK